MIGVSKKGHKESLISYPLVYAGNNSGVVCGYDSLVPAKVLKSVSGL